MKIIFLRWILVGLSLGGLETYAADGEQRSAPCPDPEIARAEEEDQLAKLNNLNELLAKLASGESVPDLPLNGLFSIDVKNQESVDERIVELETELGASATAEAAKSGPVLCPNATLDQIQRRQRIQELVRENIRFKLDFFRKPLSLRSSLVERQDLVEDLKQSQAQLSLEIQRQKEVHDRARKDESEANQQLETVSSRDQKDLAAAKAALESAKASLASFHSQWLAEINLAVAQQKSAAERLLIISGQRIASESNADKTEVFLEVVQIWRQLTDEGLKIFRTIYSSQGMPALPDEPSDLLKRLEGGPEAESYKKSRLEAQRNTREFEARFLQEYLALADKQYHILDQASKLRAQVYGSVDAPSQLKAALSLDDEIKDFAREIKSIPYRALGFLYTKYMFYKSSVDGSFKGLANLGRDGGVFLVILMIPLLASIVYRRLILWISNFRLKLAKKSSGRLDYALLILRLSVYLPYAVSWFALHLGQTLLLSTAIPELTIVFELGKYFIYYKIFRLLVQDIYNALRLRIDLAVNDDASALITSTAKNVGRFFLFSSILLYLTRLAVGEVLVFDFVTSVTQFFGLLVLAISARRWDFLIVPLAQDLFPQSAANRLKNLCVGYRAYIFCLPLLLAELITLGLIRLGGFLERFDFSKKISARFYRHRIDAMNAKKSNVSAAEDIPVPDEYARLFELESSSDSEFQTAGNDEEFLSISKHIEDWRGNPIADNTVAIFGEKGMGKTSLLDKIARTYSSMKVVRLSVPAKILDPKECRTWIEQAMQVEQEARAQADSAVPTLVLVDEVQNLYLGKVGGFEAYLELMQIVNIDDDHIFWCLSFNIHAWIYLQGYFSQSRPIRLAERLTPWSDTEISELILKRHKQSPYRLKFDQAILATRANDAGQDTSYAEKQYFRLLWEQSKGNPRIAMCYWLSSLVFAPDQTIRVLIPKEPNTRVLDNLTEDSYFVYAAIARHENLNHEEVTQILNIPSSSAALALKYGVENRILIRYPDRRYRISPEWHNYVVAHLKRKNFLYG